MIKKIQIELIILVFLVISIFLSYNIDIGFYNYFSKLNNSLGTTFLKEFFVGITVLGDSLWYFLVFVLIFSTSYISKKTNIISLKNYSYLKNFSLYSLFYLLSVGLVTQILKHLVGRPRPNHADINENFGFNFFTTDSAFHSFPSGHSSTIIAVTLVACTLLPSLRVFFYICGFLIALSRVVVGAHFITDVIAGSLVAIILFKIINFYFKKKYPSFLSNNFEIQNVSALTKVMVIFFVIAIFVSFGSSLDIYFSGLFYLGNNQFLLQTPDIISIFFRKIMLPVLLIYIFVFPILSKFSLIQKIFFKYRFSLKNIMFIWLSGLLTLVIIVNVLLKNMWGRTRPNDILHFGGKDVFTPWYTFGDSCVSNCSFVSGDSSVGFMLVVFYFLTKKHIYFFLALVFGTLLGLIRIIAGGHFLSDVIFSQIVVITSVSICFFIYKRLYDK